MKNVKPVCELVGHLHTPFPVWLKLPVQSLQSLACHDSGFLPSSMLVRQFLALVIQRGLVMVDVEKISWHGELMPLLREEFRKRAQFSAVRTAFSVASFGIVSNFDHVARNRPWHPNPIIAKKPAFIGD